MARADVDPFWAALGLLAAAQFAPILLGAPYAGVIIDRVDERQLVTITQAIQGLLALALGVLSLAGGVEPWMVFLAAGGLGTANAFEAPARHTFISELAGPRDLGNAVALHSLMLNSSRAVGPAMAGALMATIGIGMCFVVNAATSAAAIAGLRLIDPSRLHRGRRLSRARGQIRQGLRYVSRTPELRTPLLVMAAVGALSYEFPVVLPLVANQTFHAGAGTYGLMIAAMGSGAIVGGLGVAGREAVGPYAPTAMAIAFGVLMLFAAAAPTLALEFAALFALGAGMLAFVALTQTTLQLTAASEMRGRVMSLWTLAWAGTTPIGGPIVGWLSQEAGARWGLALGGVTAIVAGVAGAVAMRGARNGFPGREPDLRAADGG